MPTFTFSPVGQDRRRPRGRTSEQSPLIKGLIAGETLLVQTQSGKPFSTGWTNRVLKRQGLRAVTRKDPDGTVVWAEPIKETNGAEVSEGSGEAPEASANGSTPPVAEATSKRK